MTNGHGRILERRRERREEEEIEPGPYSLVGHESGNVLQEECTIYYGWGLLLFLCTISSIRFQILDKKVLLPILDF